LSDHSKLDGQIYILKKILRQEELNTTQIAKYLEVSDRSVRRYIEDLSTLFEFPIESKNKKWQVPNFIMDVRSYNANELVVIKELFQKIEKDNAALYEKAIELFNVLNEKASHTIYKQSSVEDILSTCKNEFYLVKNAIENTSEIKFSFFYDDNIKHVQPLKIANLEKYWYLLCFDIEENRFSKYHFKGVRNVEVLDNKFDIKKHDYLDKLEFAINAFYNIYDTNKVKLKISKEAKNVLSRKELNPSQKIYKDKNGEYILDITVSDLREISPLIQQWIPHIHVIEPKELKNLISENLKNYDI
jgi:predicted DNA-binding transcriptional regulator YafY